ncbi:MAG TPA: trypsin-like peptidase domain-containing protein [Gemmatimonadales bacterium]|nr:trypsin-like peptidase domain-containing protein [Gemmatimonadales bacterium]
MSARTRDWLKFVSLVGVAFVFGLLFASALNLTPKSTAAVLPHLSTAMQTQIPQARSAAQIGDAFVAISNRVRPAVVYVSSARTERAQDNSQVPAPFRDFFQIPGQPRRPQVEEGSGTGFIVSADGYIVTNNHVVAGADRVNVKLFDKREFKNVRVVGTDPQTDVAVLKIDAANLPTVTLGNSDSTNIGEWVLAIGNPLGEEFDFTVTAGIVSAKGRPLLGLARGGLQIQDFIQTDAAINPGNSGGPLVNIKGQVIGINSAIASGTGYYTGYGFAIPINLVHTVFDQLVASGHVTRSVIGVTVTDAGEADAKAVGMPDDNIHGVVVDDYTPGGESPAKDAGIEQGDVITALDGQPVNYTAQLQQIIGFKKPGDRVAVTLWRQGVGQKTISVKVIGASTEMDKQLARSNKPDAGSSDEPAATPRTGGRVLGIGVQPLSPDDLSQDNRLARVSDFGGGMAVTSVAPEGPAYGLLFTQDETGGVLYIIMNVNGKPTRNWEEYRAAIKDLKKGQVVTLRVFTLARDAGAEKIIRLEL